MDEDGRLYELQSHADDYANIFLKARGIYYVFKIERNIIEFVELNRSRIFFSWQCDRRKTLYSSIQSGASRRKIVYGDHE